MAYTTEELQSKIQEIDVKLDDLTKSDLVDYRIGEEYVTKSEYAKFLLNLRKQYAKELESLSVESIDGLAYELDEFGRDKSDYGE